jgi:NhaA family Na+:H+ antiporter
VPLDRLLRPFQEFARLEASGGIVLMVVTVVALVWANSPWAGTYASLGQAKLTVGTEAWQLSKPVLLWINDGLMAVFFFVVGLEIKRELLIGELASVKQSALPIAAAIGGMVVPAGLYAAINAGKAGAAGWGIPMATDIAFAIGVLGLLGPRVPVPLKIFLTALAIVDDLGAVLVIAVFYTEQISLACLGIGAGFMLALLVVNRLGARHPLPYGLLGLGLWLALLTSGVHATIAGVLVAMTIPSRPRLNLPQFLQESRSLLQTLEQEPAESSGPSEAEARQSTLHVLAAACEEVESPLQRFVHLLHPWVSFAIMPLFALANAGVPLGQGLVDALAQPVSLGVVAGLVLGKPIGITLFSWLAVRLGLALLPKGVSWRHIVGVGMLGGIGFTMSLFVADLAFGMAPALEVAKIGILSASLVAGTLGSLLLWRIAAAAQPPGR